MKCERCGKDYGDKNVDICEVCGYDFVYNKKAKKKVIVKEYEGPKTDLIDYPILSFVFGIIGMVVPIFICSILAIIMSKKPSKDNLKAFANVGYYLGILGVIVAPLLLIMIFRILL